MRAQELVERALAVPGTDLFGRVVLVTESSEAALRWANNTMTTNGHSTALSWSVISMIKIAGPDGGVAVGVVASSAQVGDPSEIEDMVRASELAARQSGPARDVAELPVPDQGGSPDWADEAGETSIAVYEAFAKQLAEAFDRARRGGRSRRHARRPEDRLGRRAGQRRHCRRQGGDARGDGVLPEADL